MKGAFRVGLLVTMSIVLVMAGYALMGRSIFAPKTNRYYAEFADAAGISSGAKVLMAGVNVGQVSEIKLMGPNLARLTLDIRVDVELPKGTYAELSSSLIGFGDIPVQLMSKGEDAGLISPGETIPGKKASLLTSLLPEGETTIAELNKTLEATRKIMSDAKLKDNLNNLMDTSNRTVEQFGKLAAQTNGLMAENRALFHKALQNASNALIDIQKGIQVATELMKDEKLRGQAEQMLANLTLTSEKASNLVMSLDQFVNDPKLREPLNATMSNVEKMSTSGVEMAKNGEAISKNGIIISEKAIELADKANAIADEAKVALEKLQGFFQKVPSPNILKGLETRMDLIRESDPGHTRADINVMLPVKDFRIHAGVWDAFESNKINLQIGQPFGRNEYRFGVYAGKPGVGVDYWVAPRVTLQGELFGLNSPRLDLRLRYDLGNNFVGWLGTSRVFDGTSPAIGIGFRK